MQCQEIGIQDLHVHLRQDCTNLDIHPVEGEVPTLEAHPIDLDHDRGQGHLDITNIDRSPLQDLDIVTVLITAIVVEVQVHLIAGRIRLEVDRLTEEDLLTEVHLGNGMEGTEDLRLQGETGLWTRRVQEETDN